jgi:hypothetical protein
LVLVIGLVIDLVNWLFNHDTSRKWGNSLLGLKKFQLGSSQEFRREGWTEKRSAVRFCLGSGLFGSYNSD